MCDIRASSDPHENVSLPVQGSSTAAALVGFVRGVDGLGYSLTAVAMTGAAINATTGVCLSRRLYVLARRLQRVRA